MIADARRTRWDAIHTLAFVRNDENRGMAFDFGYPRLRASARVNLPLAQIVLRSGVFSTPNSIVEVGTEIPTTIGSVEQCAAWLACILDRQIWPSFEPIRAVVWLEEGGQKSLSVPWLARQAATAARQPCRVERYSARAMISGLKLSQLADP